MAIRKWILGSAIVVCSASLWASAQDTQPSTPTTRPAEEPSARPTRKLPAPWRYIKDLTPEQTDQILKIHGDALVQEKKIKDKETDDIMAILSPAQVTEMKEGQAKARETAKERKAKRATTEPAE